MFHKLHAASCIMGPLYQLQDSVARWLEKEGFERATSESYGAFSSDVPCICWKNCLI